MPENSDPGRSIFGTAVNTAKKFYNSFDEFLSKQKLPEPLKNSKLVLSAAAGLFIIIVLALSSISKDVSNVPTYTVKKNDFQVSITESGELRAKNSISIATPRIRGNLKIVYMVPEGTYVKAGDVVVKFDPTEALTNLKEAESNLEVAQSDKEKLLANHKSAMTRMESDLKGAELSYELSKLHLEQMKFEAPVKQQEAKLQHEQNELSYKKAKQELESQKIIQQSELNKEEVDIQQKRAELDKAKRDLSMLTLTAPTGGLVVYETNWSTGRKIMIGDTPWPGMPVVSLPDLSAMESITYVNEVDVSRVKKGLNVLVKLDAFQDSTFKGVISSVASLGRAKDRNSDIKVFEIDVDITSHSKILKPGMTTSNTLIINKIPNVLYVPQESVFEKDGGSIVYVKDGSGFDERKVELGEKSENYVVIKKGISDGEKVALRDPNLIPDELGPDEKGNSSVQSPAAAR